ncbi:sensor domain-containing diguanylate cyclase [Chitinimonas viridis]|uniref:diguanylate cyclase n=1 Tax=Chitinimonas viridis TaxID=664880 RepID=A0ABT8BAY7_9NEIS|nr:sensor domain-containing diguanylate cyclase [Chitinimonas viridis]MDN3578930.1 sensor domain-containing diguanylate cyclase [Chitinimonas viridis]
MSGAAHYDEEQRLKALYQSGLLDNQKHEDFDFIVQAAARLCDVPQAFVAFVDRGIVWISASVDYLPFRQLPRGATFADLALTGDAFINIPDLHTDPRTASHPLTQSGFGFCMYAATPICAPNGHAIGVLSLLDNRPRLLDAEQREWLLQLGRQASALVEWRRVRKELEGALLEQERATRMDHLTGLPNRPWLLARIEEECNRAHRFGHPFSLILFDLDKLGEMNEQMGRDCGDAALGRVGRLLRQSLRNTDTAGRLSGDRFCIVLPNTSADGAATLAEMLRGRIESKPNPLEPALAMTASFGVACAAEHGIYGAHSLLAAAGAALDQARIDGCNRVAVALSTPPDLG